jgi:hypothetical protein
MRVKERDGNGAGPLGVNQMKILIAAALILATFPALAEKAGSQSSVRRPATTVAKIDPKAALARAKQRILWQLKDPDSARWRQAKVAANGDVCVEVNARNSYGGYAGFEAYYVEYDTSYIAGDSSLVWGHCVSMRGTVSINADQ